MSASCPIRSAARTRPGKSSSGLVFLVLGNWEAGVLYVGFDRCGVQVDEGFGETFADKQLGSSDMIRRVSDPSVAPSGRLTLSAARLVT